MLGPLYALVGGLYILLFRHSTNEERHFTRPSFEKAMNHMDQHTKEVDQRAVRRVDSLKADMKEMKEDLKAQLVDLKELMKTR